MKKSIKSDRISFKFASFEWLNFFGLPSGLIILGLIHGYFYFKDINHPKSLTFLIAFILTVTAGLLSYLLQLNRLKFKTIRITKTLSEFKTYLRDTLVHNDWEIQYDNKEFIQATFRKSLFNFDMLTIKFVNDNEIKWNVIHNPGDHNAILAVLTLNSQGKKIIKKLKSSR